MIAILLVLFLANSTATVENSALFNMAGGHVVFYLSISLGYFNSYTRVHYLRCHRQQESCRPAHLQIRREQIRFQPDLPIELGLLYIDDEAQRYYQTCHQWG